MLRHTLRFLGDFMQQTVNMGSVHDLCNILTKTVKRSINIECAVRVLSNTNPPENYARAATASNVVWCNVGLLFGKIAYKASDFNDTNTIAEISQEVSAMYGCVTVALPADYEKYCIGTHKDLMISGKAYLTPKTVTAVTVLQWQKTNQSDGKHWQITPVTVTPIDLTRATPGLCFLYKQFCSASVGVTLKRYFDLQGLNPCGLPAQFAPGAIRRNGAYKVTYDTVTCDVLKIETGVPMQNNATVKSLEMCKTAPVATSTELARLNREAFFDAPEFTAELQALLAEKQTKRTILETNVRCWRTGAAGDMYAQSIVDGIKQSWVRKSVKGSGAHTGRNLLEKVICDAVDEGLFYSFATDDIRKLATIKTAVHAICMDKAQATALLDCWLEAFGRPYTKSNKNVTQPYEIVREVVQEYADVFVLLCIKRILRLSCDVYAMYRNLKTFGVSFWNVMFHNPYTYSCLFPEAHIKIIDLDRIACFAGVYHDTDVKRMRAVVWMHRYICAPDESSFEGSTLVYRQDLLRKPYTDSYTGAVGRAVSAYKRIIDDDTVADLGTFLKITAERFVILDGNTSQNGNTVQINHHLSINTVLEAYLDSVFGVEITTAGNSAVTDVTYLNKELSIYSGCRDRALSVSEDDYISNATIERYIKEFEQEKTVEWQIPVTLESNQRKALQLINTRLFAVTGGAGTGKTTIIELLTRIIQTERSVKDDEVLFIAPTGKAAVRLRNVVKRPAMTIHSACRITGVPGADKNRSRSALSDYKLVVVDEASMIDLDTMYTLINALPDDCTTIFVGDIAQLAPVGAGKPFASMLRYIPVHALDVVKRVNADDLIAQNSHAYLNGQPLQQGKNYVISQLDEVLIADDIERVCTQHLMNLNGLTPDDIQIITPVKRNTYSWGCEQLNIRLRPIFNQNATAASAVHVVAQRNNGVSGKSFYVGDRVVHTRNARQAVRYDTETDGRLFLPMEKTTGVMNGDIGKIRYIVDGSIIRFGNDTDILSNAAASKRAGKVYMFVEYQDIDTETMLPLNYLICYPLDKAYYTEDIQEPTETTARTLIQTVTDTTTEHPITIKTKYTVKAEGLESLQLAYALTVHKLEGSQVKLAICVLYGTMNRTFISRNLVYTMLSRATDSVYLLGDVTPGGVMTQSVKIDVLQRRLAVFDCYPADTTPIKV